MAAVSASATATSAYDRRRINAPETFAPPFAPSSSSSASTSLQQRNAEARSTVHPLFVQTGLVSQASGSAYVESGTAKVACAVYGPRQSQSSGSGGGGGGSTTSRSYTNEAELNVDVRFASFATAKRKRAGKDTESPSLGNAVRLALLPSIRLDKLPKATIDLYITVLESDAGRGLGDDDDEACTAVAATAASCALADAGIELYALVVGVHGVYQEKEELIVDPSRNEADGAQASLTVCSMPALGTVTTMQQSGAMAVEQMDAAMAALQSAAATVHLTAAKAIQDGHLARLQRNKSVASAAAA